MATATMTSKGQVTIPKEIRDRHHLVAGQRIEFLEDANGAVSIWPVTENVSKLKGMIRKSASSVSLAEMKAAIRDEGGKHGDRH